MEENKPPEGERPGWDYNWSLEDLETSMPIIKNKVENLEKMAPNVKTLFEQLIPMARDAFILANTSLIWGLFRSSIDHGTTPGKDKDELMIHLKEMGLTDHTLQSIENTLKGMDEYFEKRSKPLQ